MSAAIYSTSINRTVIIINITSFIQKKKSNKQSQILSIPVWLTQPCWAVYMVEILLKLDKSLTNDI